ncbi:hypothetical protein R3P38DRAFT_3224047 [Favolaschia claudopus]|uniref:F-box domain-containing protein n=1 Tax=Favolaschia claudopus TaxID=2862362 RepID=A0AAV9ZXE5_9AGAR
MERPDIVSKQTAAQKKPGARFLVDGNGTVFPVELLTDVVLLACGLDSNPSHSFDRRRNKFLRICKTWYQMLENDFRFWATLLVDRHTTEHEMKLAVRRARDNLLSLIVDMNGRPSPYVSFRQTFPSIVRPCLDFYSNHFGSITLLGHGPMNFTLVMDWMMKCETRTVTRVRFNVSSNLRGEHITFLDELLPNSSLKTYVTENSLIVPPDYQLRSLSHLMFGPLVGPRSMRWATLFTILNLCANLTHLVLHEIILSDDVENISVFSRVCQLPLLTHMRVDGFEPTQNVTEMYALACTRTPNLRVLRVSGGEKHLDFVGCGLPETHNPTLRDVAVLSIGGELKSSLVLLEMLRTFPELRILDIRDAEGFSFETLIEMRSLVQGELCPKLTEVHVPVCFTKGDLVQFVGARPEGFFARECTVTCHWGLEDGVSSALETYALEMGSMVKKRYVYRPELELDMELW